VLSPEEHCFDTNTTESLDLIISGLSMARADDEAIASNQDLRSMLSSVWFASKRSGIKYNRIRYSHASRNWCWNVSLLTKKRFTQNQIDWFIPHIVNITGHMSSVKKNRGHGSFSWSRSDGGWGRMQLVQLWFFNFLRFRLWLLWARLHKMASVPLGAGMLYVKKDRIRNWNPSGSIWPEAWRILDI